MWEKWIYDMWGSTNKERKGIKCEELLKWIEEKCGENDVAPKSMKGGENYYLIKEVAAGGGSDYKWIS